MKLLGEYERVLRINIGLERPIKLSSRCLGGFASRGLTGA